MVASMGFKLGDLDLQVISGGRFRLDGGILFGVVPKVLWQRRAEPNDLNRIQLETNCLLVHTPEHNVLIDTGYGNKGGARQRVNYELEAGHRLTENLMGVGIEPDSIDVVIQTHLHFDHAGGCTVVDETGGLRPTFPHARYFVQEAEWEDATCDRPELAGTYMRPDFMSIKETGVLELVNGDTDLMPGIGCCATGGHTRGHQILYLGTGHERAVYLGDLCPTSWHLQTFWAMAYDQYPLDLRRIKLRVLGEAADHDWLVLFAHDAQVKAAYLRRDDKQQFVVREQIAL